jgi:hypothetical protein
MQNATQLERAACLIQIVKPHEASVNRILQGGTTFSTSPKAAGLRVISKICERKRHIARRAGEDERHWAWKA